MKKQLSRIDIEEDASAEGYPNSYAPIPANGQSCPHTGLKHAHLYKLLAENGAAREFVRVVSLRDPKARHGKRCSMSGTFSVFSTVWLFSKALGASAIPLKVTDDRSSPKLAKCRYGNH